MTSMLAEIDTPDGHSVLVELQESPGSGMQPVGRGHPVQRVARDLGDVLQDIKPALTAIVSSVDAMAEGVDKVSVKLGFKISISGTVILAATAAEGHIEVNLEWARKPAP
jgi:hypothetical protein